MNNIAVRWFSLPTIHIVCRNGNWYVVYTSYYFNLHNILIANTWTVVNVLYKEFFFIIAVYVMIKKATIQMKKSIFFNCIITGWSVYN